MYFHNVALCARIVWYDVVMLTVPEAAKIAGKNPETIRRWIRSGKLPAQKFGTQHVVDEVTLDELVNGIRAEGVPDWMRLESMANGIDPDEIVLMMRRERDEH